MVKCYRSNIIVAEQSDPRYFVFCDTAQCPALAWNVLQNGGGASGKCTEATGQPPPYGPTNHVHAQAHAAGNNN